MAPTYGGTPSELNIFLKLPKMFRLGGQWTGECLFHNNKFIGFDSTTNACGGRQSAITNNKEHPDYHPIATFRQNAFIDTDASAMFYLHTPRSSWMPRCGTFTCTALYNHIIRMEMNSYSGIPSVFGVPKTFDVTSNNKESTSTQVVPTCIKKEKWNAYMCRHKELGLLLFES